MLQYPRCGRASLVQDGQRNQDGIFQRRRAAAGRTDRIQQDGLYDQPERAKIWSNLQRAILLLYV